VEQDVVPNPSLWTLEHPELYSSVQRVYAEGQLVDGYRTPFGIRVAGFAANHGLYLNGKAEKFRGVCIDYDLGAFGAAFSEAAVERRRKALKAIRADAIRCSHNPMAPQLCDL
jgi:beta-galactosidase